MGVRKGTGGGPLVAIAAHLDTVFPEGTDVKVRRAGTRLAAPGIGDNTRSLAVLLEYPDRDPATAKAKRVEVPVDKAPKRGD